MRSRRVLPILLAVSGLVLGLAASSARAAEEPFYRGKTIRINVGYAPGGGFDVYSRTIARHLGRHIPGTPTVVVDNMPGAGGLTPKDRVHALRKGFQDTMKDPEFLAEAQEAKLDIDPVSGEEIEKIVAGLFRLDPALVATMREVVFQ